MCGVRYIVLHLKFSMELTKLCDKSDDLVSPFAFFSSNLDLSDRQFHDISDAYLAS